MPYIPYYATWHDFPNKTTPITAAAMQHIETGITNAGSGGSGVIEVESTPISSAQLLALHVTPVEILPALTGRNYYVIHDTVMHYRFVTTPYNESIGQDVVIGYGSLLADIVGAGALMAPAAPNDVRDFFTRTTDTYVLPPTLTSSALIRYVWDASVVEAKPLSLAIGYGGSLTGGDSTLTVRTFYSVIDGAP